MNSTSFLDSMVPINENVSLTTRNTSNADKDKLNQKIGNGIDIGNKYVNLSVV